VYLPGIGSGGIISNDQNFAQVILDTERRIGSRPVLLPEAGLFSVYYPPSDFARTLLAIDPRQPHSFRAGSALRRMGCLVDPEALPHS
jgi:hypothetical protein